MIRGTPNCDAEYSIASLARVLEFDTSASTEAIRQARADLRHLNNELFRHMRLAFHDRNRERAFQRVNSLYRVVGLLAGMMDLLEEHPAYKPEPLPAGWEDGE